MLSSLQILFNSLLSSVLVFFFSLLLFVHSEHSPPVLFLEGAHTEGLFVWLWQWLAIRVVVVDIPLWLILWIFLLVGFPAETHWIYVFLLHNLSRFVGGEDGSGECFLFEDGGDVVLVWEVVHDLLVALEDEPEEFPVLVFGEEDRVDVAEVFLDEVEGVLLGIPKHEGVDLVEQDLHARILLLGESLLLENEIVSSWGVCDQDGRLPELVHLLDELVEGIFVICWDALLFLLLLGREFEDFSVGTLYLAVFPLLQLLVLELLQLVGQFLELRLCHPLAADTEVRVDAGDASS
jgi:hypothetical protein